MNIQKRMEHGAIFLYTARDSIDNECREMKYSPAYLVLFVGPFCRSCTVGYKFVPLEGRVDVAVRGRDLDTHETRTQAASL